MPMKMLLAVVVGLFLVAPVAGLAEAKQCASVHDVKTNVAAYSGRPIMISAILASTRHGSILVDTPNGAEVLLVRFADSGPHANSAKALLDKIRVAFAGQPTVRIRGVFEGTVTIRTDNARPEFVIYREVFRKNGVSPR
jgi:hypothetical protein